MPWDIARCMLTVVHHNAGICMSGVVSHLCTVHGCTITGGCAGGEGDCVGDVCGCVGARGMSLGAGHETPGKVLYQYLDSIPKYVSILKKKYFDNILNN